MSTVSPLLGRKFSSGRLKRHREACARRKAEGFYETASYKALDPRTRIVTLTCALPGCGNKFQFILAPRFRPDARRYCSPTHQTQHNHILRTRCPRDYETLYQLYVTQNMTAVEIGLMFGVSDSTVGHALRRAGVPLRGVGPRKRRALC